MQKTSYEMRISDWSSDVCSSDLLFLSVFLLLLAFLILLNAISTFEETKSRAVMDSMSSTFRSAADARGSAEIYVSNLGTRPNPAEGLEAMGRLWLTATPRPGEVRGGTEGGSQFKSRDAPNY